MGSDPLFWRWLGWKSRQVFPFLESMMEALEQADPSLLFGIMLSEQAVSMPVVALRTFSQDLLEAKRHPFDFYLFSLGADKGGRAGRQDYAPLAGRIVRVGAEAARLLESPSRVLLRIPSNGREVMDLPRALGRFLPGDPNLILRVFMRGPAPADLVFAPRTLR